MFKKISFVILLCILAFSMAGNAKSYFQLTGTIKEAKAKDLNLWVYKNYLASNPDLIVAALTNGSYKFKTAIDQPVFAILEYNNSRLKFFFEPGDSVDMSFKEKFQP